MRKVLLVFLILVIGGVVAADRFGVGVAEREIGKRVAAQYNLTRQPEVKIHGFPFLTQVVGGKYDRIDVGLGDWTEQGVTVNDVNIEMHGVKAALNDMINGRNNVTAQTATASAIVPYQLLKDRAPKGVEGIAPKGSDLELRGTYAFLGVSAKVNVVVSVKATSRGIAVTPQSVSGAGIQVPLALVQNQLTYTVPVKDLPIGSRISDIQVTPGGLRVAATARDVSLNEVPAT
jgi:hypothetical protein